jgi:hypothetical protein
LDGQAGFNLDRVIRAVLRNLSLRCWQYSSAMISDFLWLRVWYPAFFPVLKFAPSWNVDALLPRQAPFSGIKKPIDNDRVVLSRIPPAWARGFALDYSRFGVDGHACCIKEDNFATVRSWNCN